MDFVSVWKAASIVLTGAFGILGLFTEFKHSTTKKVTKWGYVSLTGIIVSMILGTIAQLRETQDSAAKALVIAQRSQETLTSIQRAMFPLSGPRISVSFDVDCDATKEMRRYCDIQYENATYLRGQFKWPPRLPDALILDVDFFLKGHDPLPEMQHLPFHGDWSLNTVAYIRFAPMNGTPQFSWTEHGKEGIFTIVGSLVSPDGIASDGKLISILDVPGSTIVLRVSPNLEYMKPKWVEINVVGGQTIRCVGPFNQVAIARTAFSYECSIPEMSESPTSQSTGSSAAPAPDPSDPEGG